MIWMVGLSGRFTGLYRPFEQPGLETKRENRANGKRNNIWLRQYERIFSKAC